MTLLHPHLQEFNSNTTYGQPRTTKLETNTSAQGATIRTRCLKVLGVNQEASTSQIESAYKYLVADITPSPEANHSRVGLAQHLLAEVEQAYTLLKAS